MGNLQATAPVLSSDMQAWISGLAEPCEVPWRWREKGVMEVGPGEPWISVLIHFGSSGEWQSVWFERSPAGAIHRGQVSEGESPHRSARHVYLDMTTSLAWNSWLAWFEQRHGILEPLPDWVSRGLAVRSLKRDKEIQGSMSSRQGGNYRRAAQRAQEILAATHKAEYEALLEQFLTLEGLSSYNGY